MDFKSGGHGFQCWSLQIAMSYKVWDSCVVVMMKLVIWAQEEVYSLHLLFLNSKFMFSWQLQLTSLSPCLFWVLKIFCVFCLAFVVASYNLGACNCHDCACNRVCAFFFFFEFCFCQYGFICLTFEEAYFWVICSFTCYNI
jgi:hypothetical protein